MEQKKIDRINELAQKAKLDTLTAEETQERAMLRQEYIASFRGNLQATLDNISIVDEQGNEVPLKPKQ